MLIKESRRGKEADVLIKESRRSKEADMRKKIGIYIHIPFCASRCSYCDFNTYAGIEHMIPDYIDALTREAASRSPNVKGYMVDTVFIGGGTPSFIDAKYIQDIMLALGKLYDMGNATEISIESNPGTLDPEKLEVYLQAGINRLSIGLQCWQKDLLDILGRIHSADDFARSLADARRAGFKNINADLIFGIPGQTIGQWEETLYRVIDSGLEHVSCYSLKLEEGTPLAEKVESGKLCPVPDEYDREMYYRAIEILSKAGYHHYEISNFALPGFECRHNISCWKCGEYIGLGPGAHSYFGGSRTANMYKVTDYIDRINKGADIEIEKQFIDKTESMKEYMILGLRLIDGICPDEFREKYGEDMFMVFGGEIRKNLSESLLEIYDNRLRLTGQGLDLANKVFMEFI